jgi:hypothetical protein
LNGGKAAGAFAAHVAPELKDRLAIGETLPWTPAFSPAKPLLVARLPSTSPVPTRAYRSALDKLPLWSSFLSS